MLAAPQDFKTSPIRGKVCIAAAALLIKRIPSFDYVTVRASGAVAIQHAIIKFTNVSKNMNSNSIIYP